MDEKATAAPFQYSSSNNTYFRQQALQDLDPRSRSELREAILREMEKESIREGIIAAEIGRKRAEEAARYEVALRSPAGQELSLEERLGLLAAARRGFGS
ncbi:hypothetical protein BUALT_Bualt12G0078600 [Buddleja alternifolia]|uniref:Uncharacterized protein n=1 Tax=Buddleja alternifolia TaxID=168488 RepID=A0AAV6WXJ1_9LAMI|nr:hypothetical protein BUALT_Bualt12G0078600 [Buddleja alternifolia]